MKVEEGNDKMLSERSLFAKLFNNFLSKEELKSSVKLELETDKACAKHIKLVSFDSSGYDGAGLYDD